MLTPILKLEPIIILIKSSHVKSCQVKSSQSVKSSQVTSYEPYLEIVTDWATQVATVLCGIVFLTYYILC